MSRKNSSPFDQDVKKKLESDTTYAEAYFEAISDESIPVQMALLRRVSGLSQEAIAVKLHVRQSYISRLEKKGSDHLLSTYQKLAELMNGKIMIVPKDARVVFG